jgi:hypothetical protein
LLNVSYVREVGLLGGYDAGMWIVEVLRSGTVRVTVDAEQAGKLSVFKFLGKRRSHGDHLKKSGVQRTMLIDSCFHLISGFTS